MTLDDLARRMFSAYNSRGPRPWTTFDGRAVPMWEDLGDEVREKWRAAAQASVDGLCHELSTSLRELRAKWGA